MNRVGKGVEVEMVEVKGKPAKHSYKTGDGEVTGMEKSLN